MAVWTTSLLTTTLRQPDDRNHRRQRCDRMGLLHHQWSPENPDAPGRLQTGLHLQLRRARLKTVRQIVAGITDKVEYFRDSRGNILETRCHQDAGEAGTKPASKGLTGRGRLHHAPSTATTCKGASATTAMTTTTCPNKLLCQRAKSATSPATPPSTKLNIQVLRTWCRPDGTLATPVPKTAVRLGL